MLRTGMKERGEQCKTATNQSLKFKSRETAFAIRRASPLSAIATLPSGPSEQMSSSFWEGCCRGSIFTTPPARACKSLALPIPTSSRTDTVGSDIKPFQVRVTAEWLAVVHNWRQRQRKTPSIGAAIRTLVEKGLEAEAQKKEEPPPPTPISEIPEADTYLKKLHENGEINIHEYKRRTLIAARSKQQDSSVYAQELQADPDYFIRKAASMGDGCTWTSSAMR
jgi:hypothetical protein